MDANDLSRELSETLRRSHEQAQVTFRNMQTDAISRQQHADKMLIESQKLQTYDELLRQIKLNNEMTHKEFELQERKNKRRFWISAIIAGLSAIGAIISAIIAIISVCK